MELLDDFDTKTLERAFDYVRSGHVKQLTGDPANVLVATVHNGRGTHYQQRIQLTRGGAIEAACTCPVGSNCKHAAAALIVWMAQGARGPSQQSWQRPLSRGVQTWLERATELLAQSNGPAEHSEEQRSPDYPEKIKERLLYVLDLQLDGLKVSIWKGRVNAQGTGLNAGMQRYHILQNLRTSVPKFIRPVDLELVGELAEARLIYGQYSYGMYSDVPEVLRRGPKVDAQLIERICNTGRCFVTNDTRHPLRWSSQERPPDLSWQTGPSGAQKLCFAAGQAARLGSEMIWVDKDAGLAGRFINAPSEDVVRLVMHSPEIAPQDLPAVAKALPSTLGMLALPKPVPIKEVTRPAQTKTARLTLDVAKTRARGWYREKVAILPTLTLRFDYEGTQVAYDDFEQPRIVTSNEVITLTRDTDWEAACFARLEEAGAIRPDEGDFTPGDKMLDADLVFPEDPSREAMRFTFQIVPQLRADGWEVTQSAKWPYQLSSQEAELSVSTQPGNGESFQGHNWFSLGFQAKIGSETTDIAPLVAAFLEQIAEDYDPRNLPELESFAEDLETRPVYVSVGKDGYAALSLAPIASVLHMFLRRQSEMEHMHPSEARLAADVRDALAGSDVRFSDNAGILPLAEAFRSLSEERDYDPPSSLRAELRPYQAFGADWMTRLANAGFGGVLADDMGLGKTLQALTTVLARKEAGQGPSLLIAPTSLLYSWQSQAAQFAPDLKLLTLHGLKRKDLVDQIPDADLVLTTYPLLTRDKDILCAQVWNMIIVDEAQTLKNPASQMAKALRALSCSSRLALTGTPVENSLEDLWTLFDWVVPGLLGNRKTFADVFRKPIEKLGDASAQARLNRRVRPFLLRRTKEDVATELPPRTEILDYVELSKPQQALYETVRTAMDERVREAVTARGLNGAQITILDALLKLRQVCCDPRLVKSEAARSVTESAKRQRLTELLRELVAEGRRVLVFSQFTSMLDLVAEDLREAGTEFALLTGQTKDRKAVLEAFQKGNAPVFLLSLKAGGVGLTLTEADTVILYDPWWNPAVERQAMDRAHRIGQDKPVFVYRLVAKGTVEEKILSLQARKQALADALLSNPDTPIAGLFDEDILNDLFAPLG